MVCFYLQVSLLDYDDDGNVDHSTIIPMVDGGTEGLGSQLMLVVD